jgi:hypothetical protein
MHSKLFLMLILILVLVVGFIPAAQDATFGFTPLATIYPLS